MTKDHGARTLAVDPNHTGDTADPFDAAAVRRRWRLLALAVLLGLSWFGMKVLADVLSPLYTFSTDGWWPQASVWRLIVGVVLYLVAVPWLWRRFFPQDSWAMTTGLRAPRTPAHWVWTVVILLAVLVPSLTLLDGTGKLGAALASPVLVLAALQPPVVEEVLMRGLFVRICERGGFGPVVTTLVGALVFASWHVASFGPASGLETGLVSIPFFFVTRYLTGGVWVPIVIHLLANAAAFNGVGMLALLVVELVALVVWWGARIVARRRARALAPSETDA